MLHLASLFSQVLTYSAEQDDGYAAHTDCDPTNALHEPGSRMASLIVYLADDFDGGETEFPLLGLKLKPPVGSALLFYNYGPGWGGEQCNRDTLHRSNPVTRGTKVVLQRWYVHAALLHKSKQPSSPQHALASLSSISVTLSHRYTYAEQAFLSSRQMPREGYEGLRPWQPVLACDPSADDPTAEKEGVDARNRVSCRWYNAKLKVDTGEVF